MKYRFVVEIDIPEDFVVDPSADVELIRDGIWEMFPNLPQEAIIVAPEVPVSRYALIDALVEEFGWGTLMAACEDVEKLKKGGEAEA